MKKIFTNSVFTIFLLLGCSTMGIAQTTLSTDNKAFPVASITTGVAAPTVTGVAASSILVTTATLNGTVNANGASSVVSFEYGTTTGYGSTATASQSPVSGSTVTSVSGNITGLTANTTYHFRVKAVNAGGTSYSSDLTFQTLTPGTWTGNGNSSQWTVANNWAGGAVPTSTTDVTIPSSGITYLPMIFPTDKAECNNFTVAYGNLEILSYPSGTGSLIVNGTASGNVWSDVYLPANQWHYIAPPVDNCDISSFVSNNYDISKTVDGGGITTYSIAAFNEGTNARDNYFTSSTYGTFALGKGYTMKSDNDNSVGFYGSLVVGTKNISLTKTGQGWNCIGNPYTSAIDINATATSSSFLYFNTITNAGILDSSYGALYFWNESAGQYNVISNATLNFASKLYSQNYAACGDAFFVKAATNGASVSFTKNMQSHQNLIPTSTKTSWPAICIKVTNNSNTATTVVAFNSAMTNGLDVGYDAGLLRGTSGLNIYSNLVTTNGNNFAIQCLPETYDNTIVPLSVECTSGGSISFSAETVSLPAACYATLEDNVTGTLTDLKSGQTYSVSVAANSVLTNRFYLHTSKILPVVITGSASNISATSATLNGSVNAYGASTTVTFEYGLTAAYGTTVTATQSPVTGSLATAVSKAITGLVSNTTYHFRVVGVNVAGTTNGTDQTFTTSMSTGLADVQANDLLLYPNPATDGFTINAGEKASTVSIYDLSGSLVLSQQITGKSYINISSLQQGVYVVKANGLVGKLVKK